MREVPLYDLNVHRRANAVNDEPNFTRTELGGSYPPDTILRGLVNWTLNPQPSTLNAGQFTDQVALLKHQPLRCLRSKTCFDRRTCCIHSPGATQLCLGSSSHCPRSVSLVPSAVYFAVPSRSQCSQWGGDTRSKPERGGSMRMIGMSCPNRGFL